LDEVTLRAVAVAESIEDAVVGEVSTMEAADPTKKKNAAHFQDLGILNDPRAITKEHLGEKEMGL
jgi:hypothetical protein